MMSRKEALSTQRLKSVCLDGAHGLCGELLAPESRPQVRSYFVNLLFRFVRPEPGASGMLSILQQKHRPVLHAMGNHQSQDRKSTRLNSSHTVISYAVFCLKKKKQMNMIKRTRYTRQ